MKNFKKAAVNIGYLTQDEFDKQMKWTEKDAREYIKLAIKEYQENSDYALFLHCIMRAVKWVGVTTVARKVRMSRQGIYDALDRKNANPSFQTLAAILKVLGVKTTFVMERSSGYTSRTQTQQSGSYASL